jgi:hypothetical protein
MASFSMTCTCGHTMTVDAANRDEAVSMLRAGMTQQALDEHMAQYHQPGDPKPTLEQAHEMIGQTVQAAA